MLSNPDLEIEKNGKLAEIIANTRAFENKSNIFSDPQDSLISYFNQEEIMLSISLLAL